MIDPILFFIYDFLWTLFAGPLLPFARRSRTALARLGADIPSGELPPGALWVHALSVGEVNSAIPLVKALREKYPLRAIVFTASTTHGLETARAELGSIANHVLRMSVDFWSPMRRMIRFIQPEQLVIVETDLWPGILHRLRRGGIPVLLVNGRISPSTLNGYRKCPFLVNRMIFKNVDRCLMQSDLDCSRLLAIGVSPEKVESIGNIKFDREPMAMDRGECLRLGESMGFHPGEDIWVAGSTHQGEEEIVLDVFLKLRPAFPALRLVIAPRNIEESGEVLRSAHAKGLKAVLKTSGEGKGGDFDLLILDTIGELGKVYGICRIAFVGGSLVQEGGHNLLEPASLGRPVLFGPHMYHFVSMSEQLLEAGGGMRVSNKEEMYRAMEELLADRVQADAMGKRAMDFAERNRGALKRVMEHIR